MMAGEIISLQLQLQNWEYNKYIFVLDCKLEWGHKSVVVLVWKYYVENIEMYGSSVIT